MQAFIDWSRELSSQAEMVREFHFWNLVMRNFRILLRWLKNLKNYSSCLSTILVVKIARANQEIEETGLLQSFMFPPSPPIPRQAPISIISTLNKGGKGDQKVLTRGGNSYRGSGMYEPLKIQS